MIQLYIYTYNMYNGGDGLVTKLCPTLGDPMDSSLHPSMEFSRQEYWSGLPYHPPGDFPDPGIEFTSFTSSALAGRFFTTSASWEELSNVKYSHIVV